MWNHLGEWCEILGTYYTKSRSQWPRGLRLWFSATRFLGLWVGNLPRAWMSVSFVFCKVEVSTSGWSPVQSSRIECGVSECDRKAPIMRKPWPTRGCCSIGEKMYTNTSCKIRLMVITAIWCSWIRASSYKSYTVEMTDKMQLCRTIYYSTVP